MTAQTQTENYIKTVTYKVPSATKITAPTISQAAQNTTYFDGLGRPKQQVSYQQSASGKDLVTPIEYDGFGRQTKEYLPYASSQTSGAYIDPTTLLTNVIAQYQTKYGAVNTNPFSEKNIESSPLNRVLQQGAPGNDWTLASGHTIKLGYNTNVASEVKLYYVTTTWTVASGQYEIALGNGAGTTFYTAGQLYKNITYDENTAASPTETAGSTVEFKNKEGQVVLKRTYDAGVKHDTYYVYDNYGNLTYVIPPKADAAIDVNVLNSLCYQYKYDNRNRLVEKKLPGKQWEFIVYDKLDRPVATGPAFSPFKDDAAIGWLITKYDALGRPIYTGWNNQAASSASRKTLQDAQNLATVLYETKIAKTIDGIATNYNNSIAPTSFKLLTVNYYDDYVFPGAQPTPTTIEGQTVLTNVKTLATGSWTRAVSTAASIAGETSTTFYGDNARPVRTYTQNHLGGYTFTDSKLDFTGKALYTISKHKRTSGSTEMTIREDFTYSPQDRLLTHTHQINGGAIQLMAANTYDELGQLISKNVGNTTGAPLQKVDFNYNIRGWLTEINKTANLQQGSEIKDLFAFKINYNTIQAGITGVTALYNGNISETFWRTGADNIERAYGYKYDNLNRLKNAIYEKSGLTTNAYDENLTYDKNGNIMSLVRKGDTDPQVGIIEIDNLAYTYPANSNQLGKVTDNTNNTSGFNDFNKTGDDYTYDANGNMITDKNKNITAITYNQLNLPKKITFGTTGSIEYIYNAAGQKLEKIVTEGTVTTNTNYLDGFQYKNTVLEFFPTAEGYVKNTAGALSYVFQYKDHLGNIRLSYAKNPTTQVLEIIEENNYYPFGLKHKGYNDNVPTGNKYKYNGKELQDELSLNLYDYGARNYDPAIGRWMNIDPLAENYFEKTPYMYAGNNPLMFVDYDGMDFGIYINHDTKTISIKSHYIVNSNDSNLMNDIASYWNEQSGNFAYAIGEGVDAESYSINFDVTVEVDDSAVATEGSDFLTAGYQRAQEGRDKNPNNNEINSLVTSSDHISLKRDDKKQGLTGGNDAVVRSDAERKTDTGKHEVGHNFGMSHASGLMSRTGGSSATTRSVGETLSRVGLGASQYGDNTGNGAIGSINGISGTAPANFTAGSVVTQKSFDRKKNEAIKRAK
ncbi:DUF6443 domain-containing protein [Flavobacterium sp. JAS]|uniref:DUF6443 domain-containing protein n=1 Tax=Flavobacterium sp. JAS TaxID=2897329 RepID=UPI001E50622A|nr:DUF6443 domain-containing protein [Flavobacterium sp. JAS]MCD0472578.1 RHS repeat-associated core domain-containing protein [Flavobacterium sp. JAS]